MGIVARDKQRQVEPRLVIRSEANRPVDDVVKALIDEWLVPALVEEYIRLNQVSAAQPNHPNEDTGSLKAGTESLASWSATDTKKIDETALPKTRIQS